MILNPYYYIFSKIIKKLKSINVNDEDILFASYAVLFMIFIPHLIIFLFILKHKGVITGFDLGIPKHLFGLLFALIYWLINYLLFGWRARYIKIIECYDNTSKTIKYINILLLLIYFSIPFFFMVA
jgi:hypothetical protein